MNAHKHHPLDTATCLIVFLVGVARFFDITLIARVPVGELVAFGSIPYLLRGQLRPGVVRRLGAVAFVALLWAMGVIISDVSNFFIFERFVRGVMKPVFSFLWVLFFVGVLLRDFRALYFLALGLFFAALQNYLAPRAYSEAAIMGQGYAGVSVGVAPIIMSLTVFCSVIIYRKGKLLSAFTFLTGSISLFIVGAPRSTIVLPLLSCLIILYVWFVRQRKGHHYKITLGRLLRLACIGGISMLMIYYCYVFMALEGWMGELQYNKIKMQSTSVFGLTPLGLILEGRAYVFAAILGILDKPIVGHGSWTGVFMSDYYFQAVTLVETDAAVIDRMSNFGEGGKAGHSVFFTAWLENGLLAATSMVIICFWVLRELVKILESDNRFTPMFIAMGVTFMWAFFFSPFGISERMAIGLFLALNVVHLQGPRFITQIQDKHA